MTGEDERAQRLRTAAWEQREREQQQMTGVHLGDRERSGVSLREHGRSLLETLGESDDAFKSYVQARWKDALSSLPPFARSLASPQVWFQESAVSLRAGFESQVQG